MKMTAIKNNDSLIFTDKSKFDKISDGEYIEIEIHDGKSRSVQQNNLYWAACKLISDNTEDINFHTPEKVSEQCKIACRFVDYWITYLNTKTGQQTLNIKTKSISFSNCDTEEANIFFTDAFKYLAGLMKMSVDDFINTVKGQMVFEKIKVEFNGEVIK